MLKDPEKFGLSESVKENIDDMLVSAHGSSMKLQALLQFFEEMFELAKPFTDINTGEIRAPNGKLPVEKLSPSMIKIVNSIDGAFIETMSYCQWLSVLKDSYWQVRKKIGSSGGSFGEKLK